LIRKGSGCVPDFDLTTRTGLEPFAQPGRFGASDGEPGLVIRERQRLALATVMARKGQTDALVARVRQEFSLDLPATPRRSDGGWLAFVWAGPGHWLALAEAEQGARWETRLRNKFGGLASVADQSDSRVILRLSGSRVRETLAKGVMLDLHPSAFKVGDVAVTRVAHVGVHLWQRDGKPTYEVSVARSYAGSFWRWLVASGAEYGISVEPPN
jgi:sarcosine oxidase subunit gamma